MSGQAWMQLAGPRKAWFSPQGPDLSALTLRDLAHMLANVNRFGGATSAPMSVAQHCVTVAMLARDVECLPAPAQMKALLHDGHEAFLPDLPTPVKAMFGHEFLGQFERAAREIDREIERALLGFTFDIEFKHSETIKRLDLAALAAEAALGMMPAPLDDWHLKLGDSMPELKIASFWPPAVAQREFEDLFITIAREFCEPAEYQ